MKGIFINKLKLVTVLYVQVWLPAQDEMGGVFFFFFFILSKTKNTSKGVENGINCVFLF